MLYPILLVLGDSFALLSAFTIAYIYRVQVQDNLALIEPISSVDYIKGIAVVLPFWLISHALIGLYRKEVYEKRLTELGRLIAGSFAGILLVIGFEFVTEDTVLPARLVAVYAFLGSYILLAIVRNTLWIVRRISFRYGYGLRHTLLIGDNRTTADLVRLFSDSKTSGYDVKAIVATNDNVPSGYKGKVYKTLTKALKAVESNSINTVIQTELYSDEKMNQDILRVTRENHLSYRFIPPQSQFFAAKNTVEIFNGYPLVNVHQTPLIGWGRVGKRLFDIFGSIIGIIISAPIILIVGFLIKITDPAGPIFYKHKRITRYGNEFYILKMRSMIWKYSTGPHNPLKTNEEIFKSMGREDLLVEYKKFHKVTNDPRVSKIGNFIRKTSIDELPQFWNVLKGELSLVGPRPMVEFEMKMYKEYDGDVVTNVKSGISGLWQVSGRSELSFEERVKLDRYYVQNWSFMLDIRILLKTIVVVIRKTGADR